MLTNLGIQVLMAKYLGAGSERDALFVAMSVPLFLNTLMVASFGAVVTPAVLASGQLMGQRGRANRMLFRLTAAAVVFALALYLFRGALVQVLAPGFPEGEQLRTVGLLEIVLAIVPLQSASCILGGYWIARERVLLPSLALMLGNMVILAVVAGSGFSLSGTRVAWAFLGGAAITLAVQGVLYSWEGWNTDRAEPEARAPKTSIYRQSLPLMASSVFGRSAPLIERRLASSMGEGTISCLGYAGYLVSFLVNATTSPTATAYYAQMCRHWNEGRQDELTRFLEKGALLVVTCSLALGGAVALSAHEFLRVIAPYTRFSAANVAELADYGVILMIAYVFLAFSSFIARIFYAAGRFVQAALLDCVAVVFYVVTALPLSHWFGGYGLVIAACLNAAFLSALILVTIKRQFAITLPWRFWAGLLPVLAWWTVVLGLAFLIQSGLALRWAPPAATAWSELIYLAGLLVVTARAPQSTGLDWRQLIRR